MLKNSVKPAMDRSKLLATMGSTSVIRTGRVEPARTLREEFHSTGPQIVISGNDSQFPFLYEA